MRRQVKRFLVLFLAYMLAASTFNLPAAAAEENYSTANSHRENNLSKAEYLLDEDFSFLAPSTAPNDVKISGWDVKSAGGSLSYQYYTWFKVSDTSNLLAVSMDKKFNKQSNGKITLEYRFKPTTVIDGLRWELRSGNTVSVNVYTSGANLYMDNTGGNPILLQTYAANTEYGVKVIADITQNKADVYINGVLKASNIAFKNPAGSLDNFNMSTGEASTGDVYIATVKIYKGYIVNEKFISAMGNLPEDWKTSSSGGSIVVERSDNASPPDSYSLKMDGTNSTSAMTFRKIVSEQSGKQVFQYKVLFPGKVDGIAAELLTGDKSIFKLVTSSGKLCYINKANQVIPVYDYITNLWYSIKIEIDTKTSKADIYVNSKLKVHGANLPESNAIDAIQYSTSTQNKGVVCIDDIQLYNDLPLPSDYVPAPKKVASNDIMVGVQSCSMWKEGHHLGWDRINPYPERKPLLGYYDEGNPETADWEIKWMAEHGINFQMFCWVRDRGSINEGKPIKAPDLNAALNDGYMNAKYSDQIKFNIMWENAASRAKDSTDFRNNIVPYWIEYYLKDPRYLVVDNKPVIAIYSLSKLKTYFGGTDEGVKAEMDYLRSEVKKLGFDDATLLICNSDSNPTSMSECKSAGFDAVFAYSWGSLCGYPGVQQIKLQQQRDAGNIDMVPVISTGRDDAPWGGNSGYFSTPSEFEQTAQWVKDTFMPSLQDKSLGKKMVLLDNWNEYGEGHFLMPADLNEFGYLDAVRNVFAGYGEHKEFVPTQKQKDRICVLYPQDRKLPSQAITKPEITKQYSKKWDFNTDDDREGWASAEDKMNDITDIKIQNGVFSATSIGSDPWMISPDNLGLSAEDNPYIHIKMKNGTKDPFGKFYFITDTDQKWSEDKSVSFMIKTKDADYTDYYAEMWKNTKWTGNIKQIRYDPSTEAGDFGIDLIGMVYSPLNGIKTYLNDQYVELENDTKSIDSCVMIPMDEFYSKLNIAKQWNDNPKQLIALKNGGVYKLTLGTTAAYKDNTIIELEHSPVLSNGIFYVPASFLKQAFGYLVSWDEQDKKLSVYAQSSLPVKGENLITDPGMELGSSSQISNASITREYSTEQSASGNQSIKVTKQGTYGSIYFRTGQQVKGQEYYYSAWLKLDSNSISLKGDKPQYPVARICVQYKLDGVTKQNIMLTSPKLNITDWQHVDGTYTINENGMVTDICMFVFTDLPATTDTFYIDNVEIRPVTYTDNPIKVSGIGFNKTAETIGLGNIKLLSASIQPSNAINKSITWNSDNNAIAVVDNYGYVYGKSEGTANITAVTADGGKTTTCAITVKKGAYETVTLTVKPDGTGDFISPKLANDSITDSSSGKQYIIEIYPGVYTEKNWTVKPYTTLKGTDRDNCWLKGENLESATNSEITDQSTVWLKPTANLENLKITCRNMRYPVHSEDSGGNKNAIHTIKNCYIEHYGNLEAVQYRQRWTAANPGVKPSADLDPNQVWGGATGVGSHAWGFGAASGEKENFYDSTFISKADGWYVHNREDFTVPQINAINNCKIISTVTFVPITIESLGSGTTDQVIFNNCEITGNYIYQDDKPWITQKIENQYADHADYNVTLNGCTTVGYLDGHRGRAMAIFSNSTGSACYVRINGTAVNDILGKYTTKDGGGNLKGYIYGYWDISGIKVGLNSDVVVNNTLGRRLGNCTITNKTLNVTFENGITKNIIFNEDYTNQSNAYILGKINNILGSSGSALEYNVTANEYYPQVIDKQIAMINTTGAGIARFSAVCLNSDGKGIRAMKATDPADIFLGITLEGIAPGKSGRVLTEGIMNKNQLNGFSGTITKGTQISVSVQDGGFGINAANPIIMNGISTDWAYFKGNTTAVSKK